MLTIIAVIKAMNAYTTAAIIKSVPNAKQAIKTKDIKIIADTNIGLFNNLSRAMEKIIVASGNTINNKIKFINYILLEI